MQREVIKKILDMLVKEGIIRISFNPFSRDPAVEVWSLHGRDADDKDLEYWRPSREEKEFYASEYAKCFDTAPRSDEE